MKQSIAGPKQRRVKAPTAAAAATGADDDSAAVEKKVVFQPPHVEIIQLSDITDEAKSECGHRTDVFVH
jgi:hypothetical protein